MNCPRTGKPMKEVEIAGVKVDVSTGCGGVWLDNFELKKFDEPREQAGEQLIAVSRQYGKSVNTQDHINCPRHPEVGMRRHCFSIMRQVVIDECPQCGGIWLDPGELEAIRVLFPDEKAKSEAADDYFNELFSESRFAAMKRTNAEELKKARRFANLFKYICPSYYVPGEQKWGAF